jgi:hypothetical protein
LAYVAGEEDFVDANGNNVYDLGESFTDLGRAYRDDNGSSATGADGVYNSGESQIPRDGVLACVDGIGCAGDGVWGTADVRRQVSILFASSSAVITSGSLTATTPYTGSTPLTNVLNSIAVTVADTNGNSMPTGTTVDVSALDDGLEVPGKTGTNCTLTTSASYTIGNSYLPYVFGVGLKNCTAGDSVLIKVTSPLKLVTERIFTIQ